MIQAIDQNMQYEFKKDGWYHGDFKVTNLHLDKKLHTIYISTCYLSYTDLPQAYDYVHVLVKQKKYELAISMYYKMLDKAKQELSIKDMDILLSRICSLFHRTHLPYNAIQLYQEYGGNKNLKRFHDQMFSLFPLEMEELNMKELNKGMEPMLEESPSLKKDKLDVRITVWGGFTSHSSIGKLRILLSYGKTHRYIQIDEVYGMHSANQTILFGYAYALRMLKEPCLITFISNAHAGLNAIFNYLGRPLKQKKKSLYQEGKYYLQQLILQGDHKIHKEIIMQTIPVIERTIEDKQLTSVFNRQIYELVSSKFESKEHKRKKKQ